MADAGAVGVADFERVCGDGDAGVEGEQFSAAPHFRHFINALVGGDVGGCGGVGDFGDAPLERAESSGALRVGKCAGGERDSIDGISADAGVGDGRLGG